MELLTWFVVRDSDDKATLSMGFCCSEMLGDRSNVKIEWINK